MYRRYGFTPAKVEVEEHHVKVYAGKKTDEIVKSPHPERLLRGSLVQCRQLKPTLPPMYYRFTRM